MVDVRTVSAKALAYLGDAALEVLVRTRLVEGGISASKALNQKALEYVRAGAQAQAMERIAPHLTEEETAVFHRGRNQGHNGNTPKSATVAEYRNATGMEALFGYLSLIGARERMAELFALAYPETGEKTEP